MSRPAVPPIRVLNLPQDRARRESMRARLDALGLAAQFLAGVDGRQATVAREASCPLSPGEWGCYQSHRQAWAEQVSAGEPWAVVLEDDVLLDPRLAQRLAEVQRQWPPGLHGVRLSHLCPAVGRGLRGLPPAGHLILPTKNPSGGQGYLLTLEGARQLLEHLHPGERPLDSDLDHAWQHGIALGLLLPAPVRADAGADSRIGPTGERARVARSHALGARCMRSLRKHLALARLMHRLTGRPWAYWQAPTVRARTADRC